MPFRVLETATFTRHTDALDPQGVSDGRGLYASHNWAEPFRVTTAYETDVAFSTYEANDLMVSRDIRPRRAVTASYLEGGELKPHLEQFLARTSPRTSVPTTPAALLQSGLGVAFQIALECDNAKVTNVPSPGTVDGDFSKRRFYAGARAYIVRRSREPFLISTEYVPALLVTLNTVTDSQITLTGIPTDPSTGFDYVVQPGWTLVPAIDCLPLLNQPGHMITSGVLEADVEALEFPGTSTLPPTGYKGVAPSGFSTFTDQTGSERLVFPIPHNWKDGLNIAFTRAGQEGEISRLAGTEPRWLIEAEALSLDRNEWWDALRLFDAVSGQGDFVWAISPEVVTDQAERGSGNTSIIIPPQGNENEFAAMTPALAYQDGSSWVIVELDTFTPGSWDLPLLNPLTGSSALGCVHRAFVARFSTGEFSERWITRDLCESSFSLVQTDYGLSDELGTP